MELKRFIADNSREALLQVKQHHGEDALIISTNKIGKKTEVICAIEDSAEEDIEKDKIKTKQPEGTESVKIDLAQRKTVNKREEDYRNEISNMEFSEQLGRIVSKSESKKPSKAPDIDELMKTIQEDLSDLRDKLEKQATTVTPISRARSALSAFSTREKFVNEQTVLAESISKLLEKDLSEQQDWTGINMFYGMPGSGKSKTIESLLFASNNEKNKQDSVLIELIPYDIELANNFSNLMSLSQKYNVAYFRENNLSDLESRLAKFDSKTRIFVETPYENLNLHQDVPVAIHGREIKQFLCLAADSSPNILNNFVATAPELLQSILMTRMDLVADINDLLPALAEFSASIRGVYNEGRKKPLASVDLCPESIVEKEQLSPPA